MSNEVGGRRRVERFEDLAAWRKSRQLTKQVYVMTRTGHFSKDSGLSKQLQRASVSIMSNLAEGFERGSTTDFHRFVTIAKASCAEVRSQLYVAYDIGYVQEPEFLKMMKLAEEVSRILGGLKASLAKRKAE